MNNRYIGFTLILFVWLVLFFAGHAFVQHKLQIGSFEKLLPVNYVFNFLITAIFYGIMLRAKSKGQSHLGMIFLYSSMIKFLLFFILIYPNFGDFNGVKSAEFASFFVPYALSLSIEIYFLTRMLNS